MHINTSPFSPLNMITVMIQIIKKHLKTLMYNSIFLPRFHCFEVGLYPSGHILCLSTSGYNSSGCKRVGQDLATKQQQK